MKKVRIGIAGYGNLGKGVELAIKQNDDTELVAVFTRRNPETVKLAEITRITDNYAKGDFSEQIKLH